MGHRSMGIDLDRICDPRSRSRSLGFWSSDNCTFLGLSPPPFWHGAQNWWFIMIMWNLLVVCSLSEPDFLISFSVSYHATSNFDITDFQRVIFPYCLRLESHRRVCSGSRMCIVQGQGHAAMTVSPLTGLFILLSYTVFPQKCLTIHATVTFVNRFW